MERAHELLNQLVYLDDNNEKGGGEERLAAEGGGRDRNRSGLVPTSSAAGAAATAPLAASTFKKRKEWGSAGAAGNAASVTCYACRPWSRDDLLRRLRTYSTRTWFCKLDKVSSIVCASKGWVNTRSDELECEVCKAIAIYPSCPSPDPKEVEQVAEKFLPLLDSLHNKFCPWKGNKCESALLKFPLMSQGKTIDNLKRRVENLCSVRYLPKISNTFLTAIAKTPELESKFRQILQKRSRAIQSNKMLNDMLYHNVPKDQEVEFGGYQASLLVLAMCGWESSRDASTVAGGSASSPRQQRSNSRNVLQCDMCGSKAGIWNFDKQIERPCQLDYLSWKHNGSADASEKERDLPRESLRGTAKATGYTCLTSPLYVASPMMVSLHKTIAGGDTFISSGLQPEQELNEGASGGATNPSTSGERSSKRQKVELNTRDPSLCRSVSMHPLNAHRKYCPWRYNTVGTCVSGSSSERSGWIQCLEALAPNDIDHPQETQKSNQYAGQEDVVSMLNKVQRVIG